MTNQVAGEARPAVNEAAERLANEIRYRVPLTHEYLDGLLDAALDWERRNTVERIRAQLDRLNWPGNRESVTTVRAILDEVAGPGEVGAADPCCDGPDPMTWTTKLRRSGKAFFERETARLSKFARWLDSMKVARALRRRAKERR